MQTSIKSVSDLTSDSLKIRMEAVLAQNRTPDVMPANDILLSSEEFAAQWKLRYSEDNVNMPGFQITAAVSMILGLPILVFRVPQRSVSRLLCLIGQIYLYLIGAIFEAFVWVPCSSHLHVLFFSAGRLTG